MSKDMEEGKGWMEKADQFEMQPSPALWKNIESDLQKHKRKRRIILWFFIAVSLFVSSGVLYIINQNDEHGSVVEEKNKIESTDVIHDGKGNYKNVERNSDDPVAIKGKNEAAESKERAVAGIRKDKSLSPTSLEVSSQSTYRKKRKTITVENVTATDQEQIKIPPSANENSTEETLSENNVGQEGLMEIEWEPSDADYCDETNAPVSDSSSTIVVAENNAVNHSPKDSSVKTNAPGKYSLQFDVMPLISQNNVTEHTDLGLLDTYRNESTKSLITYAAEVRMINRIDKFLSLGIGLGYYCFGEQLLNEQAAYRTDTIYPPTAIFSNQYDINTVATKTLLDSALKPDQYIKTNYQYMQFPLGITVDLFNRKKISVGIGADIIYLRLIKADYYEYDYDVNKYYKRDNGNGQLRRDNFSFSANVSLNYRLSRTAGVFIAPAWTHFFNSVYNKQSVIDQKHNAFGLKAGLTFYFK